MTTILDIRTDGDGKFVFHSDYRPLKGMNLYQRAFVTFMFDTDLALVRRCRRAVRLLGIAEVCCSRNPELSMRMFEQNLEDLSGVAAQFIRRFGGNLNFKPAV